MGQGDDAQPRKARAISHMRAVGGDDRIVKQNPADAGIALRLGQGHRHAGRISRAGRCRRGDGGSIEYCGDTTITRLAWQAAE